MLHSLPVAKRRAMPRSADVPVLVDNLGLEENLQTDEWRYPLVVVQPGLSKKQLVKARLRRKASNWMLMLRDRVIGDYGASFSAWTGEWRAELFRLCFNAYWSPLLRYQVDSHGQLGRFIG